MIFSRNSKPRVNLHHFTLETGLYPRGESKDLEVIEGFKVDADVSDSRFPILYHCGHPRRSYYSVVGCPGVDPVFERRGKNQPKIVAGVVGSISVEKALAEQIVTAGPSSIGDRHRAEEPIDSNSASFALLTIINYTARGHDQNSSGFGAPNVTGITKGRLLSVAGLLFTDNAGGHASESIFMLREGGGVSFTQSNNVEEASLLRATYTTEPEPTIHLGLDIKPLFNTSEVKEVYT